MGQEVPRTLENAPDTDMEDINHSCEVSQNGVDTSHPVSAAWVPFFYTISM